MFRMCLVAAIAAVIIVVAVMSRRGAPHHGEIRPEPNPSVIEADGRTDRANEAFSEPVRESGLVENFEAVMEPTQLTGELQELREHVSAQYSIVRSFRREIVMDTGGFGKSQDSKIQELLDGYNNEQMRLASVEFAGLCRGNWSGNRSVRCDFQFRRENYEAEIEFNGSPGSVSVKAGLAWGGPEWQDKMCHLYYLDAFAVFDPARFGEISTMDIEVAGADDDTTQEHRVYRVESKDRVLYFDTEDKRLCRIEHKDPATGKLQLRVDCSSYTTLTGEGQIPLSIRVSFLDTDNFPQCPEAQVMQIDLDSIRIIRTANSVP